MIEHRTGDLLKAELPLIAHQTNCLGVMGAGIAKQIKVNNPNLFKEYRDYCKSFKDKHDLLGTVQYLTTDNGKQIIANLFGEYSFCESIAPFTEGEKPRHTDYNALHKCIRLLYEYAKNEHILELGIPYKLGCGLAGGNWDEVVYPMIQSIFYNDPNITLFIYKL